MLPDIYLDPRNESEYKELKFVNFMAAVLAFYDLPDDKMINVDAEAFRRSLGILGELEAWKNKIIIVQYIFVKLKSMADCT